MNPPGLSSIDALHTGTLNQFTCYISYNAETYMEGRWTPLVLTHEVTYTKFEMKYPDRFILTSSGQEWQSYIATDI